MGLRVGMMLALVVSAAAQTKVVTHGESSPAALVTDPVQVAGHEGILLGPAQMRRFYGIDKIAGNTWGAGQTVAILISHADPYLEGDLAIFDERFGLPLCTAGNGCLRHVQTANVGDDGSWEIKPGPPESGSRDVMLKADGKTPIPSAGETVLDVEWVHAIAPAAKILLIEIPFFTWPNFLHGVDVGVAEGATVMSMSFAEPQKDEHNMNYLRGDRHFATDKTVFVAAAGDHAHGARWPAASPDVVGVGGRPVCGHGRRHLGGGERAGGAGGVRHSERCEADARDAGCGVLRVVAHVDRGLQHGAFNERQGRAGMARDGRDERGRSAVGGTAGDCELHARFAA